MRLVSEPPAGATKLLFYTDAHISDRKPRSRKGDYRKDVLAKLVEIVNIAVQEKVDVVVEGGDLFHKKDGRSNSHMLVNLLGRMFSFLEKAGIPHIAVVGNHDVMDGRLEALGRQPLAVLDSWGVLHVPEHGRVEEDRYKGLSLVVHHSSYESEGVLECFDFDVSAPRPIVQAVHTMLLPVKSGGFPGVPSLWWEDFKTGADIVLIGHPHAPQKIAEIDGCVFVSPGSVGRCDKTLTHTPMVALLHIGREEVCVQYIPLKSAKPYAEVFVTEDTKLDDAAEALEIKQFVEGYLAGAVLESRLTYAGLVQAITAMEDLDAQARVKALYYLDVANG